jgi:hypothetical protein
MSAKSFSGKLFYTRAQIYRNRTEIKSIFHAINFLRNRTGTIFSVPGDFVTGRGVRIFGLKCRRIFKKHENQKDALKKSIK